jgi:hypothetical protein
VSAKGCLTLAIVLVIAVWTAIMGGLIAAGMVGIELLEWVIKAVFGDTPEATRAIDAILGFVRGSAGGFLGLIWGIGTAALIALWLVAWRSARDVRKSGSITVRVGGDARAFREMKDVTPDGDLLPPPDRGDERDRR